MNLVDLEIHGTAATAAQKDQMVLILKEVGGERILPITTSTKRALLLMSRKMLPISIPIPLSVADAMHLLLEKMGVKMKLVELTAVKDGQVLSRLVADKDGEEYTLDWCPAPDGLIIHLAFGCRLCIEEELLEAQYMRKVGENAYVMNINSVSRAMLEDALKQAVDSENYEAASMLKAELDKRKPIDNQLI